MTKVLLLRGINVGGHGKLPMAVLKEALIAAGADQPETYIQSGNAVLGGEVGLRVILQEIESRAGLRPGAVMIEADDFLTMVNANPFPEATNDPKALLAIVADLDGKRDDVRTVVLAARL